MNDLTYAGELNTEAEAAAHTHGGFELICFKAGGTLEADGEKIGFLAGEVAVIPPLIPHRADCQSGLCAMLEKGLLPVRRAVKISAENAAEIIETVERAYRYRQRGGVQKETVSAAYGGLIAALVTAYATPNGFSPAVKAVMDDVEKHVGDPTYSLESFMRSLPLNYDYVRKLFKKEAGLTPHEHLTQKRMERARVILSSGVTNRYSDYTVTQIAEACGFSEPLYFSRVFKKYFGVAPSHYLKNL